MVFFYFIKHLKSWPAKARCYENTLHGLNHDVILSASIRKTMIHRSGVSETSANPFNQIPNKETSSFMLPLMCIHFIVNFLSVTVRFTVIRSVFAIEAFYKISVSIFRFHGPV